MYLRKSIRSYKGGSYTNYLLVESIHTAKGPRQKTVCSLGDLGPRPRAVAPVHQRPPCWLAAALPAEG